NNCSSSFSTMAKRGFPSCRTRAILIFSLLRGLRGAKMACPAVSCVLCSDPRAEIGFQVVVAGLCSVGCAGDLERFHCDVSVIACTAQGVQYGSDVVLAIAQGKPLGIGHVEMPEQLTGGCNRLGDIFLF